jgi:hypothetical protein
MHFERNQLFFESFPSFLDWVNDRLGKRHWKFYRHGWRLFETAIRGRIANDDDNYRGLRRARLFDWEFPPRPRDHHACSLRSTMS